ncbi:Gti1/Pac2 family-domain-containing protein [Mycena vulgaris]|nr:Gti1/Pac2 family-domain-containing protein [Mycena vulgaris]
MPGAPAWTDPPWSGWIETTGDALLILEAARRGLIPRVTRRLVDTERRMIASGSVFVFDEDESGIRRWTDGFFWSPSRILGNFLLYRETEKRGAGHGKRRGGGEGGGGKGESLSRPRTEGVGVDRQRERTLVGSLTNSLQTFSLTLDGVPQHLISYYKIADVESGRLRAPSSLPELASLDIAPRAPRARQLPLPPKTEVGIDGVPRYRGRRTEWSPRGWIWGWGGTANAEEPLEGAPVTGCPRGVSGRSFLPPPSFIRAPSHPSHILLTSHCITSTLPLFSSAA